MALAFSNSIGFNECTQNGTSVTCKVQPGVVRGSRPARGRAARGGASRDGKVSGSSSVRARSGSAERFATVVRADVSPEEYERRTSYRRQAAIPVASIGATCFHEVAGRAATALGYTDDVNVARCEEVKGKSGYMCVDDIDKIFVSKDDMDQIYGAVKDMCEMRFQYEQGSAKSGLRY